MAGAAARDPVPLDDVMLAMDVVDTLRHRQEWLEREIDEAGREAELMSRLRTIYASQGIAVSDAVLAEGIRALNENRFAYQRPKPGLATALARMWVRRGAYGRRIAVIALLLVALAGVYYETRVRPFRETAAALSEAHSAAVAEAMGAAGSGRADRLLAAGHAAVDERDAKGAEEALAGLRLLAEELRREYTLRIVSTVWKQPPTALHERVYYLIVEAVAPDGGVLTLPIRDETGAISPVSRWGVRVSRDVFAPVDQDFRDDGEIQEDRLGSKRRGEPDVSYDKPVLGETITSW